jgi:hypothetical protein
MRLLGRSFVLLLYLAVSIAAFNISDATQACEFLYQTLPQRISFPQYLAYENSLSSYAYLGTRIRPTCIASPTSSDDVIAIVRTLRAFSSVPFAIRGGGHNTNIGLPPYELAL